MGVPAEIEAGYARVRTAVGSVSRYVRETMSPYTDQHHYIFDDRIKTLNSLAEKLETGRFAAWSELDDLYACTVVIPTAADESTVITFLEDVFDVREIRSRDTRNKPPDVFRFDTTRVICTLRSQPGLDRPAGTEAIQFEVQIPTVFQYAWSVVTRDFVYKVDTVDWQRQRLVAQLKAAVEQIETIIAAFEATASAVVVSGYDQTDQLSQCAESFRGFYEEGLIHSELKPDSWSRFAENVLSLVRSYARRDAVTVALETLIRDVAADLRNAPEAERPVSGSLFQMVVGVVARGGETPIRSLNRFNLVDSQELHELYDVQSVPKAVNFDLPV